MPCITSLWTKLNCCTWAVNIWFCQKCWCSFHEWTTSTFFYLQFSTSFTVCARGASRWDCWCEVNILWALLEYWRRPLGWLHSQHHSIIVTHADIGLYLDCVFVFFCFILHSRCIIVNTIGWTWWDWSVILRTYLPSVLWHCWLGHLTRKNPSPIWPIMCLVGH